MVYQGAANAFLDRFLYGCAFYILILLDQMADFGSQALIQTMLVSVVRLICDYHDTSREQSSIDGPDLSLIVVHIIPADTAHAVVDIYFHSGFL
jgi:hypothetical protein